MDPSRWNCSSWTPKRRFSGQRKWRWWFQIFFYSGLGGGLRYFFIFTLPLKKWSNLTIIFFKWVGSNHHLVVYCHRQGIENQTMKNRACVPFLHPALLRIWRDNCCLIIKEAPPKTFPKRCPKMAPEGFLQNSFDATPFFFINPEVNRKNNSAYFTSF